MHVRCTSFGDHHATHHRPPNLIPLGWQSYQRALNSDTERFVMSPASSHQPAPWRLEVTPPSRQASDCEATRTGGP